MRRGKTIASLGALVLVGAGSGVAVAVGNGQPAGVSSHTAGTIRCPDALAVRSRAYYSIARAVRHQIPVYFPNRPREHFSHRDYKVWAALSLTPRGAPDFGFPRGELFKRASRLCGRSIAGRSWVVAIDFPFAADVIHGTRLALLARTPEGWRFWYQRAP